METELEQIRPIPGYPHYFASAKGEIYSNQPIGNHGFVPLQPRKLSQSLAGPGARKYKRVVVVVGGKKHWPKVGRLVLLAFVGPPPSGHVMCHGINGCGDDSLPNLSWGSYYKNAITDQKRDGTFYRPCGEKCHWSRLTESQATKIRQIYQSKERTRGEIAKLFGISTSTVYFIGTGRTWKHLLQK